MTTGPVSLWDSDSGVPNFSALWDLTICFGHHKKMDIISSQRTFSVFISWNSFIL